MILIKLWANIISIWFQISILEQNDIIEVDPDTKEMLKLLVSTRLKY